MVALIAFVVWRPAHRAARSTVPARDPPRAARPRPRSPSFPPPRRPGRWCRSRGASGPGPARYDRVSYERFGPASAKRVLILVPGIQGGAGDFSLVGPEIVRHVKGLQVWAYDRRSQAFEDHTGFATGDPDRAFGYYLKRRGGRREDVRAGRGRLGALRARVGVEARARGPAPGRQARAPRRAQGDPRRALARRVDGRRLRGVGLRRPRRAPRPLRPRADRRRPARLASPRRSLAGVKQRLAALQTADPFLDLLGMRVPWAAGVSERDGRDVRARCGRTRARRSTDFPLIPASLRAPVPVTNEGGARLRVRPHAPRPPRSSLIQVRAGRLAASGDPRPWQDGEVTPIQRARARCSGARRWTPTEWYFPIRLSLDVDGASGLGRNAVDEAAGPARVPPPHDQAAALRAPDRPHRRAGAARRAAADRGVEDPRAARRSSSTPRGRTATSTR